MKIYVQNVCNMCAKHVHQCSLYFGWSLSILSKIAFFFQNRFFCPKTIFFHSHFNQFHTFFCHIWVHASIQAKHKPVIIARWTWPGYQFICQDNKVLQSKRADIKKNKKFYRVYLYSVYPQPINSIVSFSNVTLQNNWTTQYCIWIFTFKLSYSQNVIVTEMHTYCLDTILPIVYVWISLIRTTCCVVLIQRLIV